MFRNLFRSLAYSTPLHRLLGMGKAKFDRKYWDEKLAGPYRPYLGGTISVDVRNCVVLSLIANIAPQARHLLDVGCASGSLYRAPGGSRFSYVGVDISGVACDEGQELSPDAEFHASRLEDYTPEVPQDVIVLNEVLYYLSADDARQETKRLSEHLGENGILIISMKSNPKSKAIFSKIKLDLQWVNGVLYQEKLTHPEFNTRKDTKRPAYLIGVFAKRKES